ncbi:MAG: hypothetical protein B6I28_00975 [Fusobacteriia bacterium 4572_132]|nr:MAG: hypothetical protein B6I28_00975 [Fusobacteriia bacterium 4572_132]
MKKFMIIQMFMLVFIMGCTGLQSKKEVTLVKPEYEILNLKIREDEGKLKLTWDLPKSKKIDQIYIMKKEKGGILERKTIEGDRTEIEFKTQPLVENNFTIKIVRDGLKSNGIRINGTAKLGHRLVKCNEFIDLDSNTVRFLFKTNKKATVEFYLGKTEKELKLVKKVENYDYKKGLKIEGFEAGKNYYYQVVSFLGDEVLKSKILSFTKISRNDVANVDWAKEAIFYEIFVRSFADGNGDGIGDFKGLGDNLDYLEDLGVDALWLMPTFDSPSYHGYDIVDYYNVEPDYGNMEDFDEFIKKAHKKGIKVILDLVVNHSSIDNEWMKEAEKGEESKYYDYYVWADDFDNLNETGGWGQDIWKYSKEAKKNYMGIFWSGMPDLNLRNKEVRKEIKNVAKFWLEKGVDGFRLDASKHIDDKNKEVTLNWWKEFNSYVKEVNPEAYLVGENWDSDSNVIAPFFETMDSSFNFGISSEIISLADGKKVDVIEKLNEMYKIYGGYKKDFIDATFIKNHDMERVRSSLNGNVKKVKLAATILLTLPGTPFLYYGEELGQKGMKPDANIREPFDWYASGEGFGMTSMKVGGFSDRMKYTKANDGISLEEEAKDPKSIYNYYKKLIKIRKSTNLFTEGQYKTLNTQDGVYGYAIGNEREVYMVIHNISDDKKKIDISESKKMGLNITEVISGKKLDCDELELEGQESVILRLEDRE